MRRKIKLELSGLNAAGIIEKSFRIISKMTGNASFPTPTPTLAELTAATQELAEAARTASGGDRQAILVRKDKELVVANMLRTLGAYVTVEGNGDGAVLDSSGFELQRLPEPQPPIGRPTGLVTERGAHAGAITVGWKSVKGAMSYVLQVSAVDKPLTEDDWSPAVLTTKVKVSFANMEIGKYFYYRVKAIGRNSESPWSNVSRVMPAA